MVKSVITGRRVIRSGPKVKTGCATCRTRKIKCDEDKPSCRKCVSTGRTCDGYDSPFRLCITQPIAVTHLKTSKPTTEHQNIRCNSAEITPQEVELLNRYFSIKTIFNVNLDCDKEAKQILQASLTDRSIRYAISSLRALREDYETSQDDRTSIRQHTAGYSHGIQQYNMALSGLVSDLSSHGRSGVKSALLCCQVFISIEQVQRNYASMVQHMVRGLRIMNEYRARPQLTSLNELVRAQTDQLPLLDVFIIKLFAAPCRFSDPFATVSRHGASSSISSTLPQQPDRTHSHRIIAPNMRAQLIGIATATLKFLDKVSQLKSLEDALRLLVEKSALLNSLTSWLKNLEVVQMEMEPPDTEPISVSFMRLTHTILRIIILGTLDTLSDLDTEIHTEVENCQRIAETLTERLKIDRLHSGIRNHESRV